MLDFNNFPFAVQKQGGGMVSVAEFFTFFAGSSPLNLYQQQIWCP